MVDYLPPIFLFFVNLGGALLAAVYPWLQARAAMEKTMRELELIPKDKLTPEQLLFIEQNNKPLNFAGRYVFTTIVGLVATITITVGSFASIAASLPQDLTMIVAGTMAPGIFIMGWGGTALSNQFLRSKDDTKDIEKKAMIQEIKDVGVVARVEAHKESHK